MKKYIATSAGSLLLTLALIAQPLYSLAFGVKGHQMVAEIGYNLLSPHTQETIKHYLGDIDVPAAGTWMDDQRNNPTYAYMKSWHFINLDKGETFHESDDANIVNEINKAITQLHHKETLTDEEVRLNILALFHLTGDIAQPLHDGYGSDLGGNMIKVSFRNKSSNLHKVWDSELISALQITKEDCMAYLDGLTQEQKDMITQIDPLLWMKNSRALLDDVYDYDNATIDEEYISKNGTTVKKQILFAGMRLAATLESIFGDKPNALTGHPASKSVLPYGVVTLKHNYYTTHFSTSLHIPWVVEYPLHKSDVDCAERTARSNKFAPDPLNKEATDLDKDYKNSGYDRGHNMPAADNSCNGDVAMKECFYFSNMFPQTHRLNAGVWKTLEERERDMAIQDDSVYVWIGNYGVEKTIGPNEVAVPKYCWKVIYDYKTKHWGAYIFPNTTTVAGKPEDFTTTVHDIETKSGYHFRHR